MDSVAGSTQNNLPTNHPWLTALVLDKNHNVTQNEYNLCYFVIKTMN